MPKFSVTGVVSGSKFLGEFEADTEEKAIEMALDTDAAQSVNLCHQCNDQCEDGQIEKAVASKIE